MDVVVGSVAVIGSTLVVFAYLIFIWWLDRYEREPFWMVLLTFAYGGLFGTCTGALFSSVPVDVATFVLGAAGGGFVGTVIVAPVVEELTKGLVFLPLVLTKHFDNETDGLIYGAATGLGFACVENLIYFAGAESLDSLVSMAILRTLFTAVVHCASSAMLGMAIGHARRRGGFGRMAIIVSLGYLAAITNHAVWNGLATISGFEAMVETGLSGLLSLFACGLVMLAGTVMFALTQFSLKREHDVIRHHLAAESNRGIIPAEHVAVIPYWLRRRRTDWLAAGVPREAYIESATLLAFRLYQLEHAEGDRRDRILSDIELHRGQIRGWLS